MKRKNEKRLIIVFAVCMLCSCVVVQANSDYRLKDPGVGETPVVMNEVVDEPVILPDTSLHALVLYGDESADEKMLDNTEMVMKHMRISCDMVQATRFESVDLNSYDLIVVAGETVEEDLSVSLTSILSWVEKGGKLLWGTIPSEIGPEFTRVYRKLGIADCSGYLEYTGLQFEKELIPGTMGESFSSEAFTDVGLAVSLSESAVVHVTSENDGKKIPVVWSNDTGEGRSVFYNGTSMKGDFWRGFLAGCISALYEVNMYPVINASCIFIDDFPSPQYENTSDVTKKEYNRTVKEFYRDIWWPDMQKVANRYGDRYVGLFIATYNNIVDPDGFTYDEPSMEQYYGNSLLKAGHEMGAHGYNHQSLTQAGGTPEEMGYQPWKDGEDMAASLVELDSIRQQLFPSVTFKTYVPPSNYLSDTGRAAVKKAFPQIRVISGTLSSEGEEGDVCRQDFETGEDGIVSFPRMTSGMVLDDFGRFQMVNGIGLYGVLSHFIHPDDLFDAERGQGKTWQQLYDGYCRMMEWYHTSYPYMRALTAVQAADALQVCEKATPHIIYGDNEITGSVENFTGECYFWLRSEKTPTVMDDSCQITRMSNGEYYMVTVKSTNFRIGLRS